MPDQRNTIGWTTFHTDILAARLLSAGLDA